LTLVFALSGCSKKEETAEQPATPAQPTGKKVDPANAGSLSGTVRFEGAAPKPQRIRMDAEPACAKLHAGAVTSEEIVLGDKGSLANVVVYVKSGLEGYAFDTPKEPVVLDQKGCIYIPHVTAVMVNQPIDITNSDPTTHNVHPQPVNNRDWNKSQPPGSAKLTESFAREEVAIKVKCNVHPWMTSYIAVLKHPYFRVTGKDGSFSLANLPPGNYTVAAWHETLGTLEQQVTIGPKESKTGVEFVFKAQSGD
jgi:plastocyanin